MNVPDFLTGPALMLIVTAVVILTILWQSVRVVPQSKNYVVERFGRFLRVLQPGLNLIVPLLDTVPHKVSVLERQLQEMTVSVITKDNVEIGLRTTIFLRIQKAEKAVYRIEGVEDAVRNAGMGLIRNASGQLELDEVQGARDRISTKVKDQLSESAEEWGILITRIEIMDVEVDATTKEAQRRQVQAERQRRAAVMEADGIRESTELKAAGEKRAVELAAEAALFQAEKEAQAKRVTADAEAYATRVRAEAQAMEIGAVGTAIQEKGDDAARFEVEKRRIGALEALARGTGTRTVIVPTQAVGALGAVEVLGGMLKKEG